MKMILHIGCYKTGSTSIQHSLYKNSQHLLTQGINYLFSNDGDVANGLVNTGNGKQLGHVKLSPHALCKYLQGSPGHTHILSDECLWHRNLKFKVISAIIDSGIYDEVSVIGYVRRQDHYVESFYKQEQKSGLPYAAGKSMWQFIESLEVLKSLDYMEMLKPYEIAFGHESMVLRPFEKNLLKQKDVTRDYFSIAGLHSDNTIYPDNLNASSTDEEAYLANVMWATINALKSEFSSLRGNVPDQEWHNILKFVREKSRFFSNSISLTNSLLQDKHKTYLDDKYFSKNIIFCDKYNISQHSSLRDHIS